MAYVATTWVENVTTLGPTNLNHIETGLATADANATSALTNAPSAALLASGAVYATYTPTWTATGTAPSLGTNGATVVARYGQLGKHVHAYGNITFGAGGAFGTGSYFFALPVTAFTTAASLQGFVSLFDASTSNFALAAASFNTTSVFGALYPATYLGTTAILGQTTPWTWAVSDQIAWNIIYEAA